MMMVATFGLSFAAGPLALWVLARHRATAGDFILLFTIAAALVALVMALPRHAGAQWLAWAYFDAVLLVMLWLAWIVVLALCVQAMMRRLPKGAAHKWAFAIGAMATTLPWFGLQIAQLMAR